MYPVSSIIVLCFCFGLHRLVNGVGRTEYTVSESSSPGHVIVNLAQMFSLDLRSPDQTLAISNGMTSEGAKYFTINKATGELIVKSSPDRDGLCRYIDNCIVKLSIEHGNKKNPEITSFHIQILDVNDNRPKFHENSYLVEIQEEMDTRLIQKSLPSAEDIDQSSKKIEYQLDGPSDEIAPFTILMKDDAPQLSLNQKLDRETKATYKFRVLAKDRGQPEQTGTLTVRVVVLDTNDHKPVFDRQSYDVIIDENTAKGTSILTLKATDKDEGENGRVTFKMANPRTSKERDANKYFDVINRNGEAKIVIKQPLDIDNRPDLNYKFTVIARDHGQNSLESEVKVTIRVRDVNDFKPQITINYREKTDENFGEVPENEDKFYVAFVTVTDKDSGNGGIVSCKVNNDYFYLEEVDQSNKARHTRSFKLMTRQGLDRERKAKLSFSITCHDNAIEQDPSQRLISSARVELIVKDVNDEKPQFTKEQYTFYLRENIGKLNSPFQAQVGIVQAKDKDVGNNARITYEVLNDINNAFRVDKQSGIIYAKRSFDRELTEKVYFKVKAVDHGEPSLSSTADVKVVISDVNDNPPMFKTSDYHFTVVENARGLRVGQVTAEDEDRDANAQIEYQFSNSNPGNVRNLFSINRQSGEIHLRTRLDREKEEQHIFTVLAIDSPHRGKSRNTGTATVTVRVLDENDNYPRIISPNNNAVKKLDNTEPIGKDLFTMKADDYDEGLNGTVTYGIVSGEKINNEPYFSIDKTAGVFYVMRNLKVFNNRIFNIVLIAKDSGRVRQLNSTISIRIQVLGQNQSPHIPDDMNLESGDTGRTLIVVAAIVLLLLVLAAVALLVMLRMRRVPHSTRRSPTDEMKRKWKDGLVGNVTDTYVCSRTASKTNPPKSVGAGMDDDKVDEYLLESPTLRAKDTCVNYNSLNFYKGDPMPDKTKTYHTYYEVAKPTDDGHRTLDNYVPIDRDDLHTDTLSAQKSPFLSDMRIPGLCDSEMTVVGTMRRQDKPLTPYIEASFV